MKKFIKFLCLTLTFLLTFSFIGCNKVPTNDETSNINVQLTSSETVIDSENNTVSKTITATVYPEDAPNKLVDWSIDWDVNNIGDDAIISDYITITPNSDGSNVATVTCYQGFENSSFIIKVTTRLCGFFATCKVSYDGAPENFYFNYNNTDYQNNETLEIYANTTDTINLKLSNTLGQVGSKYNNFKIVEQGINGTLTLQYQYFERIVDDDNYGLPTGEEIPQEPFNITYCYGDDLQINSNINEIYPFHLYDLCYYAQIVNGSLVIESFSNEKLISHNYLDFSFRETYDYVSSSDDFSFYIVVEEETSGKTLKINFIITTVNVSLPDSELVF